MQQGERLAIAGRQTIEIRSQRRIASHGDPEGTLLGDAGGSIETFADQVTGLEVCTSMRSVQPPRKRRMGLSTGRKDCVISTRCRIWNPVRSDTTCGTDRVHLDRPDFAFDAGNLIGLFGGAKAKRGDEVLAFFVHEPIAEAPGILLGRFEGAGAVDVEIPAKIELPHNLLNIVFGQEGRFPQQTVDREMRDIGGKNTAVAERRNEGHAITVNVIADRIEVGRDQGAEITRQM